MTSQVTAQRLSPSMTRQSPPGQCTAVVQGVQLFSTTGMHRKDTSALAVSLVAENAGRLHSSTQSALATTLGQR